MRYRSAILAVTAVAAAGLALRVLHELASPADPHAGVASLALMTFAVAAVIDAEW